MSTVFVGGSRHVSRLSREARERLRNVTDLKAQILVGDANGADKAVQKLLHDDGYPHVTVYCSGHQCRNNLGGWPTESIEASPGAKGFDFYAAKDRVMARNADYGLMIWDGKSPGTVLNILRLVQLGKKALLLNVPENATVTFKSPIDWERFITQANPTLRSDLGKRATADEMVALQMPLQTSFLDRPDAPAEAPGAGPVTSDEAMAAEINAALATGDAASVVDALGNVARARGMSQVAKETGLARESLYRSLGSGGNPEFATVFKVLSSMGLRLMVGKASDKGRDGRA
jgi:probable addiction module antidote protein